MSARDGDAAATAVDDAHAPTPLVEAHPKVTTCAYCKKPGARKKCNGCRQRTYCDKKCQRKDWHKQHRVQCKKLRQVFVPPPPGWRDKCAPVAGVTASAAGGGGADASVGAEPKTTGSVEVPPARYQGAPEHH